MEQLHYTIHLPFPISVNRIWRQGLRHHRDGSVLTVKTHRSEAYRNWIKEADALWLTQKQRVRPVMLGHHRVHVILDARRRRADGHNLMKGVLDWLQRAEIIHNDADTDFWSGEWGSCDGCTVEICGHRYRAELKAPPARQDRRDKSLRQPRRAQG